MTPINKTPTITYRIIIFMILIHFVPMVKEIVYNFENIFISKLILPFIHINNIHLFQNCFAFYNMHYIELIISQSKYIIMLLFIIIMNTIIQIIYNKITNYNDNAIGFSSVLFGLITIYPSTHFFGQHIIKKYYPYYMLILTYILMPYSPLIGHLIGIFSGYIYLFLC